MGVDEIEFNKSALDVATDRFDRVYNKLDKSTGSLTSNVDLPRSFEWYEDRRNIKTNINSVAISLYKDNKELKDIGENFVKADEKNKKVLKSYTIYKIKPGDYLIKIAQEHGYDAMDYVWIAKFNKIPNPNLIYEGHELIIPENVDEEFKNKVLNGELTVDNYDAYKGENEVIVEEEAEEENLDDSGSEQAGDNKVEIPTDVDDDSYSATPPPSSEGNENAEIPTEVENPELEPPTSNVGEGEFDIADITDVDEAYNLLSDDIKAAIEGKSCADIINMINNGEIQPTQELIDFINLIKGEEDPELKASILTASGLNNVGTSFNNNMKASTASVSQTMNADFNTINKLKPNDKEMIAANKIDSMIADGAVNKEDVVENLKTELVDMSPEELEYVANYIGYLENKGILKYK